MVGFVTGNVYRGPPVPLRLFLAPPDVARISPVEASTRYLRHMVQAWNFVMAAKDPALRLENQTVVLTVPASFDDVARSLTVEAARAAGIENLTLLEEPQAAFYCWLATHPPAEAELSLSIDGHEERWRVELIDGIVPGGGDTRFRSCASDIPARSVSDGR